MLSPEGEPQCNRCRKALDIDDKLEPEQLTFCSVECRCEYQISHGFVRVDDAFTGKVHTSVYNSTQVQPRRNETNEFSREAVQPTRWKTALWVTLAMCVAFKLATVYLQWQRGEAVTFGGRIVIKGRDK